MIGRPSNQVNPLVGGSRLATPWRPKRPLRAYESATSPEPAGGGETKRVAWLEAALWTADEALSLRRLARAAGLEGAREARKLIGVLRNRLASRRSALDVVPVAGGWRLMSRAAYAPWIERLQASEEADAKPSRLSQAASETLSIVAYQQPVVRAEIEAIRGVGCGDVLRQLLDADLLRIVGRSEGLGRPLLYGTTGRFLEVYGLASLGDLPARGEGATGAGPTTFNEATDGAA